MCWWSNRIVVVLVAIGTFALVAIAPVPPRIEGQFETTGDPAKATAPTQKQGAPAPIRIGISDVLTIDASRVVPKSPYRIEALDSIHVQFPADVSRLKEEELEALVARGMTLSGVFQVGVEGRVNLGTHGPIRISGMTLAEAKEVIQKLLFLKVAPRLAERADVLVDLAEIRGMQQIRGEHLVRSDGTVGLGLYGSVYVADMTLAKAKEVIEHHLSKFLADPEVSVDLAKNNSQAYFVVVQGGDQQERVSRFTITGNERILDVLAKDIGLRRLSGTKIWVVRPPSPEATKIDRLTVDWTAITQGKSLDTNYRLLAGDIVVISLEK